MTAQSVAREWVEKLREQRNVVISQHRELEAQIEKQQQSDKETKESVFDELDPAEPVSAVQHGS